MEIWHWQNGDIIDALWFNNHRGSIGIVAVSGAAGDWSAYIGIASGISVTFDGQEIARYGSKMRPDIACACFPHLGPERYRE